MSAKKRPKKKRPSKRTDLINDVKEAARDGRYLDLTKHATERSEERSIIRTEYEFVLKTGWHEKAKDRYDERYKAWNYAIRGKTVDKRSLRVIVSFDEDNLMVITVIDLET